MKIASVVALDMRTGRFEAIEHSGRAVE